jgi:hypothetical protein
MKLRIITPLFFLLLMIVTNSNYAQTIDLSKRYFNLKGWNVPDISKMKKISTEKVKIIDYMPEFLVETYRKIKYDKKTNPHEYIILNKKILKDKRVDLKEDLSTYQGNYVQDLTVYKTGDGNRVLCYKYTYGTGTQPYQELLQYLSNRRINSWEIMGGSYDSITMVYLADLDGDEIYESLFSAYDNDLQFEFILAFKYRNPGLQANVNLDILKFKKSWIEYMNYPSQENAKIVYNLIPDAKKVNRRVESSDEKEFWNWVWLTLPVLEKEMSAGEPYAVKIAFKLYPIHGGDFSPNLDFALAHFARVNPEMFLEEFKNNRQFITPDQAVDATIHIEKAGMAKQRYLILKKTKERLQKVNNPSLLKVKKECISYLEEEIKYLVDRFDVKK